MRSGQHSWLHVFVYCGSSLTGWRSAVWPAGLVACVCVCCGSSLTRDVPSMIWPAGLSACVCVLQLLFRTGDLPSAVWPAGLVACVCVVGPP